MRSKYLLSLIIPVYNTGKFLDRCFNSVLSLRRNDVQLIVVNDGSTDDSFEIISRYADKYNDLICFVNKKNGGHGSTINAAVNYIKGDYVLVLDSDDWLNSENLNILLEYLRSCTVDLIVSPYCKILAFEQMKAVFIDFYSSFNKNIVYSFDSLDLNGKFFQMASIIYKSSVFIDDYKALLEKTYYVDNEFLTYPIKNVKTVVFSDIYIYNYYIGRPDQSVNLKSVKSHLNDKKKIAFRMLDFLNKNANGLSENKQDYILNVISNLLLSYAGFEMKLVSNFREVIVVNNNLRSLIDDLKLNFKGEYCKIKRNKYLTIYRFGGILGVISVRLAFVISSLFKTNRGD